jgi:hypothetical protein
MRGALRSVEEMYGASMLSFATGVGRDKSEPEGEEEGVVS